MLEKKHVRPDALMTVVSIRSEVVEVAESDVVWRGVPLCMNTSSTKPSEFASSKVCERHVSVVAGAGDACLWCFQLNDIASVLHPLGAIDVARITEATDTGSHLLSFKHDLGMWRPRGVQLPPCGSSPIPKKCGEFDASSSTSSENDESACESSDDEDDPSVVCSSVASSCGESESECALGKRKGSSSPSRRAPPSARRVRPNTPCPPCPAKQPTHTPTQTVRERILPSLRLRCAVLVDTLRLATACESTGHDLVSIDRVVSDALHSLVDLV